MACGTTTTKSQSGSKHLQRYLWISLFSALAITRGSSHEYPHLILDDGLSIAFYFITLSIVVLHLGESHSTELWDHFLQSPHPFFPVSKFILFLFLGF